MGLALHGDKVLVPTSDIHVLALSAKTGEQIWDHEIVLPTPAMRAAYNLRSAPLVVGDKVIQGRERLALRRLAPELRADLAIGDPGAEDEVDRVVASRVPEADDQAAVEPLGVALQAIRRGDARAVSRGGGRQEIRQPRVVARALEPVVLTRARACEELERWAAADVVPAKT